MKRTLIITTLVSAGLLTGCGGGGGSSSASTPITPATQAPVSSTGSTTELANSVNVNGYQSLSIAATTTSSVQTASMLGRLQTMLADFFIKPAYAQTAGRCTTDAYKLVGIKDDGTYEPVSVTTSGTDSCNVGFREMFDLGSYILLTGEGIYKDDQTCNLVFLQKQSGTLYCVGETVPSRYRIASSSSSSSSTTTPSSGTASNSEKIQPILDADGITTKYVLVNAQSTSFDSNNQISGLKTKLIRFDLTDATAGPKAAVLLEGYQQGWSAYTTASDFEYFNLDNYRIAQNGDVLASYQRSFWSSYTAGASGAYRRNLKYYYDFTNGGSDYSSGNLREEESLPIFNAALNNLTSTTPIGTPTGTATMQSVTSLSQISCMFDAPNSEGGILVALPAQSWISGWDSATNGWTSQWSSSSSLFRVTAPTSSSAGKPVITFVKPTLLCSSSGSTMYGGGDNVPQKIGNTWYTLQSAGAYGWGYDSTTNQYRSYYSQKTSVIGNTLASTIGNVNDDTVFVIPTTNRDLNGAGSYYWGGGLNGAKLRGSKDYLYLISQGQPSGASTSTGTEVSRFKPSEQTSGSIITNLSNIVAEARKLTITAFTTNKKDNAADLVARDLSSDDIDKVYGTISDSGSYTERVINNSKYSTVAIVKL